MERGLRLQVRLERLARQHRPLLRQFQSQEPTLEFYLQRLALRHEEKDQISTTWLALLGEAEQTRLAGFFTLAPASVTRRDLNTVSTLVTLPPYPIPGILLARLAVDLRAQGQGLGSYLFEAALARALELRYALMFRLLVTDALNEAALRFYTKRGLVALLSEGYPRRMVLDLKDLVSAP